jgi:very-short-patch-repair endonuclease
MGVLRHKQFDHFKFRRQHAFGRYVLDFVCISAKLVVEIDGSQHAESTEYDEERTRLLVTAGFRVLRFWNNEVLCETGAVMEKIWQELHTGHGTPSPP